MTGTAPCSPPGICKPSDALGALRPETCAAMLCAYLYPYCLHHYSVLLSWRRAATRPASLSMAADIGAAPSSKAA